MTAAPAKEPTITETISRHWWAGLAFGTAATMAGRIAMRYPYPGLVSGCITPRCRQPWTCRALAPPTRWRDPHHRSGKSAQPTDRCHTSHRMGRNIRTLHVQPPVPRLEPRLDQQLGSDLIRSPHPDHHRHSHHSSSLEHVDLPNQKTERHIVNAQASTWA